MKRHPAHVRSAALAGVNPPEVPVPTAFAHGARRALEQAFTSCASSPSSTKRYAATTSRSPAAWSPETASAAQTTAKA